MTKRTLSALLALCATLTACGGGDITTGGSAIPAVNQPDPVQEPEAEPEGEPEGEPDSEPEGEPEAEPEVEPEGAWTCPETGYYFCDDFEDGTFDDKWDDLIATYDLPSPGVFDILDEASGKSLRFTAGTRGGDLADGELIVVKDTAFENVTNADYSLEYRIRPRDNGNTGNKYLHAMARYEGVKQYYFGGLSMQPTPDKTQVETGIVVPTNTTSISNRLVQSPYPVELGTQDLTDGYWYEVRFDVVGNTGTIYLDGEPLGSFTDADDLYASIGKIGFMTYNRSFEIDWVRVGDPTVKPVQLSLDYNNPVWKAEANDDGLAVTVTAIKSDGTTADTFTVESNDTNVVTVATADNVVTITPVAEGTATVTFTSGSDAKRVKTIAVEIAPAFITPTTGYGDITSQTYPAAGETSANPDTHLRLTFDSAPVLNDVGSIRIYKTSDDSEVDVIRLNDESDSLGYAGQSNRRSLNTKPIYVDGNTLYVSPHTNALSYGEEYYVAIGDNVLTSGTLNSTAFNGLGKEAGWTFSTKVSAPSGATVTVDDDNSADFSTVQGALNYAMQNTTDDNITINIANGDYYELLYLRERDNVTLKGESRDGVVIHYDNHGGFNSDRFNFLVQNSDMLVLDSLTLRNNFQRTGANTDQAEVLYFNSSTNNHRLVAKNAAFYSEQDTLQLKGYNWFYDSLIVGNVDFIWGASAVTLFENSEIRSIGDSKPDAGDAGGYILQARTAIETDLGFVFLNSELTNGPGVNGNSIGTGKTHLARSGGSENYFDNISFINTKMDDHIADIGFAYLGINSQPAPNPAVATSASGWREFGSTDLAGTPLDVSNRCGDTGSCIQLTQEIVDAQYCNRAQILASWNNWEGWDPLPEDTTDDACSDPIIPNAVTWTGAALQLSGSTTGITGSIDAQTADSVTFTANGGKFETSKTSMYLAYQEISGDFVITAKAKTIGLLRESSNWQMPAGIMMCVCDPASEVTGQLAHASVSDNTQDATLNLVASYGHIQSAGGGWGKSGGDAVTPGDNFYLKLERNGENYTASYSADSGATYTTIGANTLSGLPATLKVGFFAAPNNTGDQVFTFEDIQITQD
ncbi:Ig-like domain-containing protein [Saccharophagus degradans]|uniref:pectinesterase family protein n=1 Tax=Saccharophagus degradans TaxID=86304 RepID=UPI001C0A4212|nr:pectinesterase family protein [Saccharophagus degradans]MBU2986260.1 Ig-like domain-containing protein [Saccharophagus degradans]